MRDWSVCMHWSVYSALCVCVCLACVHALVCIQCTVYVCLSGLCACVGHTDQCTVYSALCMSDWSVCMHWSVYSALCVSVWPVCACIGLYTVHVYV